MNIMNWLLIECNDSVRIWLEKNLPIGLSRLKIADKEYQFEDSGKIFDWLFDLSGKVVDMELHLSPDDDILSQFAAANAVEIDLTDMFPRFWFSSIRTGTDHCLHDWEDYYYKSEDGTLLIALRTHMLTQDEVDTLVLSLGRKGDIQI